MTAQDFMNKGKAGVNKTSIGVSVTIEAKDFLVDLADKSGINMSRIVETLINELIEASAAPVNPAKPAVPAGK